MKALVRPLPGPQHLNDFTGGLHHWNCATKSEIWPFLEEMQGSFCAYCECFLDKRHIEHFRTRNSHPDLTFDWSNLFGSCCGKLRCGTFKENGAGTYNPDHIIKPDIDNPDDYLLFLTTGKVIPAKGLHGQKLIKAQETIRVFNLNGDSALFGRRSTALKLELKNILALNDEENHIPETEFLELLQSEIEDVEQREFSTALRHGWRFNDAYE
ncbi:retron Ec78 anti-phage system effector HNH endonuclease PtuB [Erwinia sp. Leaf53]|uniref:retron Ec78 anti-phage system effector HNH endonuclease PtuB n=1 Tax=Erwinia sp. Leaf53 TaxID=1736225 RepID=UPI0006FCED81|nr:retron Ec78 anti-phage system effector HNH endonuclease PtuB [Erwinia sp. Leaf53]KQN55425.1 hypothetical protein ASF13_07890 [Erwinia sp. Leaf53]